MTAEREGILSQHLNRFKEMAVFQTNSQRDLYLDNIEKPIRKGARRGSLSTIQPTYQHSQVQDRNEKRSSRHSDVGLPEIQGTSTVIHQQPYHRHVEYYTPPMESSSHRMNARISQLVIHSMLDLIPWPPYSCFTSLDFISANFSCLSQRAGSQSNPD